MTEKFTYQATNIDGCIISSAVNLETIEVHLKDFFVWMNWRLGLDVKLSKLKNMKSHEY